MNTNEFLIFGVALIATAIIIIVVVIRPKQLLWEFWVRKWGGFKFKTIR